MFSTFTRSSLAASPHLLHPVDEVVGNKPSGAQNQCSFQSFDSHVFGCMLELCVVKKLLAYGISILSSFLSILILISYIKIVKQIIMAKTTQISTVNWINIILRFPMKFYVIFFISFSETCLKGLLYVYINA